MKRNTWNFIVDGLLLVLFGGLLWTGFLIHFILPPRHGRFRGTEQLLGGWDRHDYGDVHFYLAIGTLVLILVHVWLHWSWVCGTLSSFGGQAPVKYRRRIMYGVLFLLILAAGIVGSLAWANTQIENVTLENSHPEQGKYETSISQMGQMSLQELSLQTGIPVQQFIEQLKLPAAVDVQKRLGRLRRQYGFEMEEVRQIVEENQEAGE